MRAILPVLLLLAAPAPAAVYTWIDEDGVTHISDDPAGVPEQAGGREGREGLRGLWGEGLVDPAPRAAQLARLAGFAEPGVDELTRSLLPLSESLPAAARMPLVDMTLPALRELSPDQYRCFRANVEELVRADDKIDLFEWTLQRILLAHLIPHFESVRRPRVKYSSLRSLEEACCVLLSTLALARAGAQPEGAYERAAAALGVGTPMRPPEECGLADVDAALFKLARATPRIKRKVLETCADYIAADGRVAVAEAELLRATADTLGCPMPPLLAAA